MIRHAAPRAWTFVAVALAMAVVTPASPVTAQEDPVEPTGRAVCGVAFTAAAAVSFSSYSVPPDAPLGPNEVVEALTPILRVCNDLYPPEPARRCFTGDLYPNTGVPVTPPDPVGIVTEQTETAVSVVNDPLGLALAGPLHGLFASALSCRDPEKAPDEDSGGVVLDPLPTTTSLPPTTAPSTEARASSPTAAPPVTRRAATSASEDDELSASPEPASTIAPAMSFIAAVPEPLRGPAVVFAGIVMVGLAVVLRRQLTPARRESWLDAGVEGGR